MKKIKSPILICLCALTLGACWLSDGGGASISVSLDADSLRKFVNENAYNTPATKGNYEGSHGANLSLKVTLSGDESGVWTAQVPTPEEYRSNVSVKVDGLRVGSKIKVRVDLVENDSTIIISGGTKNFRVSGGDNNIPIAMGNYTDIIVWRTSSDLFSYYRGEIGSAFKRVTSSMLDGDTTMTFDAVNNSLQILTIDASLDSYWYNVSWMGENLASSNTANCKQSLPLSGTDLVTAAKNGILYYFSSSWGTSVPIRSLSWNSLTNSEPFVLDSTTAGSSSATFLINALTFSPDGKKAYLAYTVQFSGVNNNYEYYIMAIDISADNQWTPLTSSKAWVAKTGDFQSSDINYQSNGHFFSISDMRVQDGYLWVLVKEYDGFLYSISRGALIRYDLSLQNHKIFGWTSDAGHKADLLTNNYYRTPPSKNSTNFFGPVKFVAVRPGELVIADDGVFAGVDAETGQVVTKTPVNRIIFFDLEKEAISDIRNVDYEFDTPGVAGSFNPMSGF